MPRDEIIETIAREFHEAYERLAHDHDYVTREESRKAWKSVPENNRKLMMATVRSLLTDEIIEPGQNAK